MEANVATLNLATNIATGKMTIDKIQDDGIYGKQIKSISCDAAEKDSGCAEHLNQLQSEICENVELLKTVPPLDYYKNAFNAQCGPPDE